MIAIIILLSHLIIRLSSALIPSLDDESRNGGWSAGVDFSNPSWHAGRYGVIVAPSLFSALFSSPEDIFEGRTRRFARRILMNSPSHLVFQRCESPRQRGGAGSRGGRGGVAVASQAEGETVERTGTGNGCEVAPAGAPRRPRRGSS